MRKKNNEHKKKRLKLAQTYATVVDEYNSNALDMEEDDAQNDK